MLFVIILLIAIIFALFSMYFGAMTLLCFTDEELEKVKNLKKGDVSRKEYWAAQYLLTCVNMVMDAFKDRIKRGA